MKTKKNRVVPKLRFPEFRDGGDWEEKNLIDVADKGVKWSFIGGPFGSNLKASDYTNKGVRVIQLQNIGDGEFVNDSKIYTSVEKADELLANNIYPHDIIMSKMGDPVGRACIIPDTHDRYVMCSDGIRLVVDEDKYSKYFVYSFINSDTFRASVESKSTGSTRKRIGLSHLKNLPLLIPSLPEQQKIADCLSSLDDLINAENEQLDALQEYKAGLLQQLFPAEGETTPKLRFAEFKDDGDWEEVSLIDVADKGMKWSFIGGPFGSNLKASDYRNKGVRVIQLQNIGDGEFVDDSKIFTSVEKADELLANNIYPNDIILSKMGDPVGRACIIPDTHDRYVMCSDGIRLVVDESKYSKYFIYSLINAPFFRSSIESKATGSTRKRIGLSHLKDLKLVVPNLKEQQKIANCLSSLDNLIQAKDEKIKTLKTHKQGLMQQLFPVMDGK